MSENATGKSEYAQVLKKVVAATVVVGAGMKSAQYYSSLKQTESRICQVQVSREGDCQTQNGDLTNVG